MKKVFLLFFIAGTFLYALDGKALFQSKCVACHGQNAELKPLGKDEIIRGMSKAKIIRELREMKDSNLMFVFDVKKKQMVKQAKKLSDEQIIALASYISTL